MNQSVIQLRHSDDPRAPTNVNWKNDITPTIIRNGDSVTLMNAFLDTSASNPSNIVYDQDVVIETENLFYVQNLDETYNEKNVIGDYAGAEFYNSQSIAYEYTGSLSDPTSYNLIRNEYTFTIPKGSYTPSEIAERLSRGFQALYEKTTNQYVSSTNRFLRIGQQPGENVPPSHLHFFAQLNDDGTIDVPNRFEFVKQTLFGATQIAVEYDVEDNGLFQFTYCHTPLYDEKGAMGIIVENITILGEPEIKEMRVFDSHSGILWTKLEPRSFWENLGFDLDYLICTVDDNEKISFPAKKYDPLMTAFDSARTGGLTTADTVYDPITRGISFGDTFYKPTTNTKTLPAVKEYTAGSKNSGYYLVELMSNTLMGEHLGKNNRKFISGYVPRQYQQDQFITGYPSLLRYIHFGEDTILSSIATRILTPDGEEADDLGPNNSLLLIIDRTQPKSLISS